MNSSRNSKIYLRVRRGENPNTSYHIPPVWRSYDGKGTQTEVCLWQVTFLLRFVAASDQTDVNLFGAKV